MSQPLERNLRGPVQDRFSGNHLQVLRDTDRYPLEAYPREFIQFTPEQEIIGQGKPDDQALYVVLRGGIEVVRRVKEEVGQREVSREAFRVELEGPGVIFGEVGVIQGVARTATVFAGENGVSVVKLKPHDVHKWNGAQYPFGEMHELLTALARERMANMSIADPNQAKEAGIRVNPWEITTEELKQLEQEANLEQSSRQPQVIEPAQQPLQIPLRNPNGVLGRRLQQYRRPTNS